MHQVFLSDQFLVHIISLIF